MTATTDQFLTWLLVYGPSVLALLLFAGAIGIPVPGSLLVIASGAFIRQDMLDPYLTPLLGFIGVICGDLFSYSMGRFAGFYIKPKFKNNKSIRKAEQYFEKRGGWAIYFTRWLITPIAIPTNLVAGSTGFPIKKFLLFDSAGELTWLFVLGGLGYMFGNSWEYLSNLISEFSGLIIGVLIFAIGLYLNWNAKKKKRRKLS